MTPIIVGKARDKFIKPSPNAQKKYLFSRCSTERLQKKIQKGNTNKIAKNDINAFCMSPLPAIISADNNAKETKNIFIGTSKMEVVKLTAVARLSTKNFNEN